MVGYGLGSIQCTITWRCLFKEMVLIVSSEEICSNSVKSLSIYCIIHLRTEFGLYNCLQVCDITSK
uniref:Uncharacterized protein n=1 Tax=Rhizophora mucronata TaxID=61149 RepID=A0A2P2QXH2_RHIMU